ncbi:MAG: Gfo/Idh/MocA family oxidoreductase [Opitutus sp.]|nr:Gfo/Idh/MocA family oxidoreductase [Opitutus sp.]MCS6246699.1 Gfo/Idh/MocA family oxidoreductase [Opitutus sp.]MCS6274511.1 Gfo/Idh/MocA family oxidoreductase [Opitutus sp.]MCS6277305.1 Gfo/Idh/MocA family oxidoreductase [Opitutus sp.]MCS6300427.1 Gfo/Idh/MocA family oxidoreductase [Opitutus sp.]
MNPITNIVSPSTGFSRRSFLGLSAGALALASTPRLFAQVTGAGSSEKPLRIALVGYGAQGRVLAESLLKIGDIKLVALCDMWDYARTYGERYFKAAGVDLTGYSDLDEMLAKEKGLDAVIIATPDVFHAPHTNTCLKAGLHVYCEKMMSNTVEGARSMVQTMKETGRLLQIGHQRHSNPRYRFTRERLLGEAKLCGQLTGAQAQWNRAATKDLGWPKKSDIPAATLAHYGFPDMATFRNWRWFKKFGGGPLSDLGAHQIDIFSWFFGRLPSTVIASGGVDFYKTHEWFDNAMVIYEFPQPEGHVARAFYQVQTTTSSGGGYWEQFMGSEGTVRISENPTQTKIYREAAAPSWEEWARKNYLRADVAPVAAAPAADAKVDARETAPLATYGLPITLNKAIHQYHLENFFQAIRGKAKLNCPADEAFRSEYPIFKAIEAIEKRQLITIEEPVV